MKEASYMYVQSKGFLGNNGSSSTTDIASGQANCDMLSVETCLPGQSGTHLTVQLIVVF